MQLVELNNSFLALTIVMQSVRVAGFDSITRLSLLEPVSALTLRSGLRASGPISVDADFLVTFTPGGIFSPPLSSTSDVAAPIVQHVTVGVSGIRDLRFNVSTLLAVDGMSLGSLPLGPAMPHLPGCFLNALENASVSSISDVHIGGDLNLTIRGLFPSSPLDSDIDALLTTLTRSYAGALEQALPDILQTFARPRIKAVLTNIVRNATASLGKDRCPLNASSAGPRPGPEKDNSVDLSKSIVLNLVQALVEDLLGPKLNTVLRNASKSCGEVPGRLDLLRDVAGRESGDVLAGPFSVPQIGTLSIGIGNVTLENADTVRTSDLKFLETPEPHRLESNIVLGDAAAAADDDDADTETDGVVQSRPFRFATDVLLSVSPWNNNGSSVPVTDRFRFGLSWLNATAASDLLFAVNAYSLRAIPLRSVLAPTCLLGMMDDLRLFGPPAVADDTHVGNVLGGRVAAFEVACRSNDTAAADAEGDSGGDVPDHLVCSSPALAPDWETRSHSTPAVQEFNDYAWAGMESFFRRLETDTFHTQLLSDIRQSSAGCGYDGPGDRPSTAGAITGAGGNVKAKPGFAGWTHPAAWSEPSCPTDKTVAIVYAILMGSTILGFFVRFFVRCAQVEQDDSKRRRHRSCRRCAGIDCVKCCHGDVQPCRACCQGASARTRKCCWCVCCCPPRPSFGAQSSLQQALLPSSASTSMTVTEEKVGLFDDIFGGGGGGRSMETQMKTKSSLAQASSLLRHPALPWCVRWGVLVLIFINICVFFSSHASMGASVDMHLNVLGDAFRYNTIFPFGLGYSLVTLWGACAVALVAFLATFSGGWVYLKLLLMAMLWCAPPALLSVHDRGRYFYWLDVFGKWSLLDMFVLVQSMIGFFVRIKHPDLQVLPEQLYHVDLIVTPAYGLYSFCLAVSMSLFLSHVQVVYHRNAVTSENAPTAGASSWFDIGAEDTTRVSVANAFVNAAEGKGGRDEEGEDWEKRSAKCTFCAQRLSLVVPFLLVSSLALLCYGAYIPSWTFTTHGLVGIAVEFGEDGASVRTQSLFSAISQMFLQASLTAPFWGSGFGVCVIACIYLAFCFVVPALALLGMMVLWVVPMKLRRAKLSLFLVQILISFSALEVWILGVGVTVLQIKFVSYSVLDRQCYPLKPLFHGLARYDLMQAEDTSCFQIDGKFEWSGIVTLISAAIAAQVVSHIVLREAQRVIQQREEKAVNFGREKGSGAGGSMAYSNRDEWDEDEGGDEIRAKKAWNDAL